MKIKNKICPFCNELISTSSHLGKCKLNTLNYNDAYILMIEKTYKCNVDDIVNSYINGSSLPDIRKKYGLSYGTTKKLLIIKKVSIRTLKESCNHNRLSKYVKTVADKYGVDNISKLETIKEKKRNSFIKNYGVDNIFKTSGFTDYVTAICLEKYGKKRVTNGDLVSIKRNNFTNEKWSEIYKKTRKTYQDKYDNGDLINIYSSKLELYVETALNELSIFFTRQRYINGLSYDFHIINTNIIIEVNGDYWHANPKFYDNNEVINYSGGKKIVNEIWKNDKLKYENAKKYGYNVIYLWEWEINEYLSSNLLPELIINKIWEEKIE